MSEWFADWFNTKYYHLLYQNRNEEEAKAFIDKLVLELDLPVNAKVMDLACGKGRHAKMLHEKGFNVVGLDLSPDSILEAKKMATESLKFEVHDMRESYAEKDFSAVFNLFTSFGYFEDFNDNRKVLHAISTYLVENGVLVIDYLNADFVINNLVTAESKVLNGITFNISRFADDVFIVKNIHVVDGDAALNFTEKVQALRYNDMKKILQDAGFTIEKTFGNYQLEEFDQETSERLIIIAKIKESV